MFMTWIACISISVYLLCSSSVSSVGVYFDVYLCIFVLCILIARMPISDHFLREYSSSVFSVLI